MYMNPSAFLSFFSTNISFRPWERAVPSSLFLLCPSLQFQRTQGEGICNKMPGCCFLCTNIGCLSCNTQKHLYCSHKASISEPRLKIILEGHTFLLLDTFQLNVLKLYRVHTLMCVMSFQDAAKTNSSIYTKDLNLCSVLIKPRLDKFTSVQDKCCAVLFPGDEEI